MSIRIIIADDHPIVLEGITNLLRTHAQFEVLATYGTGKDLLEGLEKQTPDILLLDLNFPDTTGNELVRIISRKHPDVRIIALTSADNTFDVNDMMQHGCSGYVLKSAALHVLVNAIEKVNAGEVFLEPDMKEQLFQSLLGPSKNKLLSDKLTQREQTILQLLADGKTNNEIAAELVLSHRTIENNRLSLYHKLEVRNTAELIKEALKRRLIKYL
jgi:DNA-binding NarL/FixJ family response regulator